jgi:hypothetical protein
VQSGSQPRGEQQHSGAPDCVAEHQHLAPRPPVDQYAGERADERVRHEQHREPGGDVGGIRLPFGVEQHRPRETGLENTVTELAEQPDGKQPAEAAYGESGAHMSTAARHRPSVTR